MKNLSLEKVTTGKALNNMNSDISNISLDEKTFKLFSDFIYKNTGIVMKNQKATLLSNRLRKRLRILNLESFESYWMYLKKAENYKTEISFFLDAVSTNETYFQRGTSHYVILNNYILPELCKNINSTIRIWSAGCSTGEEPYDLAIVLEEFMEKRKTRIHYKITATDISTEVLETAKRGMYADRKISKLNNYLKGKYFNKISSENSPIPFAKETLEAKDILKKNIKFMSHNLMIDAYPQEMDIIVCRNVMIYFDNETQHEIVRKFAKSLNKNGYLFIGHSETLRIIESDLASIRYLEGTIYKNSKSNEITSEIK